MTLTRNNGPSVDFDDIGDCTSAYFSNGFVNLQASIVLGYVDLAKLVAAIEASPDVVGQKLWREAKRRERLIVGLEE